MQIESVRHALKQLANTPATSLLALLTLTLAGAGAVTLASLLNAVVLRPLDLPAPEQLAVVTVADARGVQGFVSLDAIRHLEGMTDIFAAVCGTTGVTSVRIAVRNEIRLVSRESLTGGCLRTMGDAPMRLGRPISPDEASAGAPVAIISERFWRKQFAADTTIVGRTLSIEAVPVTIVGVAPPRGMTTSRDQTPDVIIPLRLTGRLLRSPVILRAYYVVGRLAPGVSVQVAEARLRDVWPRLVEEARKDPVADRYMSKATIVTVRDGSGGLSPMERKYGRPLLLLTGLALMLLAVACVNVGGMFLARVRARESALLIHLALGATNAQIAARIALECLLLSLGATALSVGLASWLSRALARMLWTGAHPLTLDVTPDMSVLLASLTGGVIAAVSVAAPAIGWWIVVRSREADLLPSLHARTVLPGGGRAGKGLIIVQMALAFGLLCCAGAFVQEMMALRRIDPGYEVANLHYTRPAPMPGPAPKIDLAIYGRELMASLAAIDGVEAVAFSNWFPLVTADRTLTTPVTLVDAAGASASPQALLDFVSPSFFPAVGISLIKGRLFSEQDDTAHPAVAIVNVHLARALFGGEAAAIGKRIHIGAEPGTPALEIVGIVETIRPGDLRMGEHPAVYRAIWQEPEYLRNPIVTLRARARETLADDVRRTVGAFGYNYVNVDTFRSVRAELDEMLLTERTLSTLSWACGALAAIAAGLGLYALLAFGVTQRRRELGLRMALGATATELRRLLLREGLQLVCAGLVLGAPIAVGLAALLARLLPAMPRPDAAIMAGAALVLLIAGGCAAAGPVRRAGHTDPAVALRAD